MFKTYKLVDKVPVECSIEDLSHQHNVSKIANDTFGDVMVSTVFLRWDHRTAGIGLPVLFETLVFGGDFDGYMERYTSYDDSLQGHQKICNMINKKAIDREDKLNDLGL